jgi:hypothetical protein
MKLIISCKQATEYIVKREEGKLTLGKRMLLWLHFCICGFCKFFAKQTKLIGDNAQHLNDFEDESLSESDKEKMIASLQQ